ncbi:MAG TPA: MarR family winged helix-turn-helix transcriptional regulator [Actinomycetota bacterium]|nr:MarR family winged helix-turn-helix transcriptional regulator [Actinomycetota bacterium]
MAKRSGVHDRQAVPGAAFLLSQVGVHSSQLWRERMGKLGLDPRHVVLLRLVAAEEGKSQLSLGKRMRLPPSRMVAFVDELEGLGLLERRSNPEDRRMRALYLTGKGRRMLETVMTVSAEHEAELTRGLQPDDVDKLKELLTRVAAEQGLAPGVHPGVAFAGPSVASGRKGDRAS